MSLRRVGSAFQFRLLFCKHNYSKPTSQASAGRISETGSLVREMVKMVCPEREGEVKLG